MKTEYIIFAGVGILVLYYLYTKNNPTGTVTNPIDNGSAPGQQGGISVRLGNGGTKVNVGSTTVSQIAKGIGSIFGGGGGGNSSGINHPTETNSSVSTTNVSSS